MHPGNLFGLSDHPEAISKRGDRLEVLDTTVDFEYFRGWLVLGPLCPLGHVNRHCRAVDGLQAHDPHQAARTMTASMEPVSRRIRRNPCAAKERELREHTVRFRSLVRGSSHPFRRLHNTAKTG